MIACALTGPMPGNASSSSLVAVLIFTAASANAENSSIANSSTSRFMFSLRADGGFMFSWRPARAASRRARDVQVMLSVDRGTGKQSPDAARNALLDLQQRRAVAGGAQAREVCLRKALVLAGERRRKRDVFDRTGAMQLRERERGRVVGRPAGVDRCRRD